MNTYTVKLTVTEKLKIALFTVLLSGLMIGFASASMISQAQAYQVIISK